MFFEMQPHVACGGSSSVSLPHARMTGNITTPSLPLPASFICSDEGKGGGTPLPELLRTESH